MIILADTEKFAAKEDLYISIRDKEERVLSQHLLLALPYPGPEYKYYDEWKTRAASFQKFMRYLSKKNGQLNILDLGCGNGWLSHKLYLAGHIVTAVDLNFTELQQAEDTFGSNERIQWVYADILTDNIPGQPYDIILLAASCQYFQDFSQLFERLDSMLKKNGSIHLLDSFFYKKEDVHQAKRRTLDYYSSLGYPAMAEQYFHHTVESLQEKSFEKKYPRGIFNKQKPQWWVYNS